LPVGREGPWDILILQVLGAPTTAGPDCHPALRCTVALPRRKGHKAVVQNRRRVHAR
jgi:hypothetical protein